MTPKTLLILVALAALGGCSTTPSGQVPRTELSAVKATGASQVDRAVQQAQVWVKEFPTQPRSYTALGNALMQRGRETGELENYNAALTAFEKAVELGPDDSESLRGLAWAWTMFHDYEKAEAFARKAIAANPRNHLAFGVLFDSQMELGRYDEALESGQTMMDLRPDLASYSRGAQALWARGDAKGAMLLMGKAAQAGGPYAENTAWCQAQLGDMAFKTGNTLAAEEQYRDVLARLPEYRHALFGLGRVEAARGEWEKAADLMGRATANACPIPYVVEYGDVLTRLGRKEEAKRQYARVEAMVKDHLAHGVHGDELALADYFLEQGRDPKRGLSLALHEISHHRSTHNYSTLAWAHYRAGRLQKAKEAMATALESNLQDPVLHARAAAIFAALSEDEKAVSHRLKAEALNRYLAATVRPDNLVAKN